MSDTERIRTAILSSLQSELDGAAGEARPRAERPRPVAGAERPKPVDGDAAAPRPVVPRERPVRKPLGNGQPPARTDQLAVVQPQRDRAERRAEALTRRADAAARQAAVRPNRLEEVARLQPVPQVVERSNVTSLPPLPQPARKRSYGTIISFLLFVILPTVVASIYYIFIASDQYVTEFRFSVRDQSQASTSSTLSTLAPLLGTPSAGADPTDDYMVADYLTSRQMIDDLQKKIKVVSLYSRPGIDWWDRFDPSQPMEKFLTYWQYMVTSNYDQITGIATARIRAFSPEDAYLIATTMSSLAEKLVNEISMRPKLDAVKFAEAQEKEAEDRMRNLRAQLSQYRDKHSVIDPTTSVVTTNTTLAQSLSATLVQYESQLGSLIGQHVSPNAPIVTSLKARIKSTREQLAAVEAEIAKAKEGSAPLSKVVGLYERLQLEIQFAQTILTSAVQNLQQAKASAASQQLYVVPYVRPSKPQSSTYPNRPVAILIVAFGCFCVWTIGLLLVRSVREHLA